MDKIKPFPENWEKLKQDFLGKLLFVGKREDDTEVWDFEGSLYIRDRELGTFERYKNSHCSDDLLLEFGFLLASQKKADEERKIFKFLNQTYEAPPKLKRKIVVLKSWRCKDSSLHLYIKIGTVKYLLREDRYNLNDFNIFKTETSILKEMYSDCAMEYTDPDGILYRCYVLAGKENTFISKYYKELIELLGSYKNRKDYERN